MSLNELSRNSRNVHSNSKSGGGDVGADQKTSKLNEEDALLESLQASRQEQDVYEEQVIREATHSLAPTLTGIGFPSLDTLIHTGGSSGAAASDLPHLHAVLGKTRRAQRQPNLTLNETDALNLKEQILLHYMHTVAKIPKEDLPIRRNEEQWLMKRQQTSGALPKREPASAESAGRRAARVPMMMRKTLVESQDEKRGRQRPDHETRKEAQNNENTETKERRAELKRLRWERHKLKTARRRAREEHNGSYHSSSGEDEFEQPAEKISALDVEAKVDDVASGKTGICKTNDSVLVDEVDAGDQTEVADLVCPICSEKVACSIESEKDAALAAHMESCQLSEQGMARRSSRVKRNKAALSDTFKSSEIDGEESPDTATRKAPKKRKRALKSATSAGETTKRALAVDDMDKWDYEDRVDEWISNGINKMREMAELDDSGDAIGAQDFGHGLVIPAWIHDRLFGYQREGLRVMWDWHLQEAGGILGDEMGLGKTVSVSAFLGTLVSCRRMRSCLIVVPATMMSHWLTELATWAPGLRRILIHTSGEVDHVSRALTSQLLNSLEKWLRKCRSNRVNECIDEEDRDQLPPHSFCGTGFAIITTYENVRRNSSLYVGHNFSYVVLDEAQKIRNPDADITLTCKRFSTPHRIAMSGTPIMNDLKELWSICDFVFPGRLGTLAAFEQEFADPIRKGGYSNASPMQAQLAYRCALVLKDLIEPYLLRRLKKDVEEVSRMPSKTEHVLFCRLSLRQRSLYESYLRSDEISKVMRGSTNLLGAITMLRKICNHPDLVCDPSDSALEYFVNFGFAKAGDESSDEEEEDDDDDIDQQETLVERSGKLEVLSRILPLWKKQGHRVLIFCQWRKMLNIVQQFMMMQGWKYGRLDGNTNIAARQRLVDTFNSDESYFAMLCTTRTGGVGLNLTGASRVVLYSPDWNPQIDAQARERAWRFGQKKEVVVYRLITAGTVEEKIYQRQIFKTALSNRVLQDPRQKRLFSQRDLRDLFTLKHDSGSIVSGADGVTETGERTKGAGVVDVDSREQDETSNLKDVMKSKGLAGIFDHNIVENSSIKAASAREMEEQAKKVAREAAIALRQSVAGDNRFAPAMRTDQTCRFGQSGGSLLQASGSNHNGSSQGLLSSLKQRAASSKVAGTAADSVENLGEYTQLLRRIKEYVRKRRPSTEAIIKEFSDVSNDDIAIFRQLLKSVAKLHNGRWLANE